MKLAIAMVAVLLLAGCATAAPIASPTVKVNPNRAACSDASTVSKDLASRIVKGSDSSNAAEFKATMDSMRGRFDDAGLEARGDVKTRIESLVGNLPDQMFLLFIDHSQYFEDLASVNRACKADDATVEFYTWG